MRMKCACADNMQMTYLPADDVRTTCGRRMSSATWNLQRSLTLVSSARRPRVVCTSSARRTHETSVPRLFQVKQQRTALLNILSQSVLLLRLLLKLTYLRDFLHLGCRFHMFWILLWSLNASLYWKAKNKIWLKIRRMKEIKLKLNCWTLLGHFILEQI